MFRWLRKNTGTFIWATLLAVAVWVAAVNASDPDEVLSYPTAIPLEIVGQDPMLVITGNYPKQIEVTLRAPRSIWQQLTADADNIHAILDLSGLAAGEHKLDAQIQIRIQPVGIVSVSPAPVTLTLEPLITRSFPIELTISGQPPAGYLLGTTQLVPAEASISGAQSLVERVERVRVSLNVNDVRETLEEIISLEVLDENNQLVRGVNLSPSETQITLPVSQQGGYRDVAVKVVVTGQVASGYRLTNISVFPPVVTAFSSDPLLVNTLTGVVETAALNIDGVDHNISTRLNLTLPENVIIVGDQSVIVEVSIEAILSSLTISNNPIEISNLAPNLVATLSPETADVIISGPLPLLDALSAEDVRVVINLEGYEIGTHQLNLIVEVLNKEINVETILPETIEVIISEASAVTPTVQP